MSLTIKKREDKRVISAFSHKLAHIPNGVTVQSSDISQPVLYMCTPIGKDSDGNYRIIKTAKVATNVASDATVIPVLKGHNFKVGDKVFAAKGGKSYAITAITTNATDSSLDDIAVGTALGVLSIGSVIIDGKSTGATAGDFKYSPVAMVGSNYDVADLDNLICEAVTMGQVISAATPVALGPTVAAAFKCINVI